jgi:hypothetical protein
MLTWATLRAQIRRLLKDEDPARYRYPDVQLLDCIAWTLDSLCSHTAIVTATSFTVDSDTTQVLLPDNVYEPIDRSGAVHFSDGSTNKYVNPVRSTRQTEARSGYYLQPANTINLIQSPAGDGTLHVSYFAYYPHPIQDADIVMIPTWATAACVLRSAAYAIAPYAYRSANVRQWNSKDDSGNPEHNPLEEMARSFIAGWEAELRNYPVQQRENYFQK